MVLLRAISARGVGTVLVLDNIGPAITERSVPDSPIAAVNVATVPQRSPLRYPGGKTWLVPHIRAWLKTIEPTPDLLIEPFAGGGIVSLTAVMEGLVQRSLMAEIDADVAAFWKAALHHNDEMIAKVRQFDSELTYDAVQRIADQSSDNIVEQGFRALVLNRTRRGGILADGASLIRSGENGHGLASRWYPETIAQRLGAIAEHAGRIELRETDGVELLRETLISVEPSRTVVFIDPPYTSGGKRAGLRLYNHSDVDHARLFSIIAECGADFLMTYNESTEILELIGKYGFQAVRVVMKNTHHYRQGELAITRRQVFIGAR